MTPNDSYGKLVKLGDTAQTVADVDHDIRERQGAEAKSTSTTPTAPSPQRLRTTRHW